MYRKQIDQSDLINLVNNYYVLKIADVKSQQLVNIYKQCIKNSDINKFIFIIYA